MTETFASAFLPMRKTFNSFLCVCMTKIYLKLISGSMYRAIKPLYRSAGHISSFAEWNFDI